MVTVGGSGVGAPLLRRVLDAVPLARRLVPGPAVPGRRPGRGSTRRRCPRRRGVTRARATCRTCYRHLAACDLAVVQGGLTTCMELTASRRPFIYVPLRHHFEQNFHVRHRLERYGAGRCLTTTRPPTRTRSPPRSSQEVGREVAYRPVETDGAARAAALLADLL